MSRSSRGGADLPDGVWLPLRPFAPLDLDSRLGEEVTEAARRREAATREAEEPERGLFARLLGRCGDRLEADVSEEPRADTSEVPEGDAGPEDARRAGPLLQRDRLEDGVTTEASSTPDGRRDVPRVHPIG